MVERLKQGSEHFAEGGAPADILTQLQQNDDRQLDMAAMYVESALQNLQMQTMYLRQEILHLRSRLSKSVGSVPPDVPEGKAGVDKHWEGLVESMWSVERSMEKVNSHLYLRQQRAWVRALLRGEKPYLPEDEGEL